VVFERADNPMLAMMVPMLAGIEFERGPGVMVASHWSGRTVEYNVLVPADELAGLMQGFQGAMMQMQGPQMR